jgi:hypothetical protein
MERLIQPKNSSEQNQRKIPKLRVRVFFFFSVGCFGHLGPAAAESDPEACDREQRISTEGINGSRRITVPVLDDDCANKLKTVREKLFSSHSKGQYWHDMTTLPSQTLNRTSLPGCHRPPQPERTEDEDDWSTIV